MPDRIGTTDHFDDIATTRTDNAVHLFTNNHSGPQPPLPDTIDAPLSDWVFTAPFNHGTVVLSTGVDTDFPELRNAYETLDYTVVVFDETELVHAMLTHLADDHYSHATELIQAYYQWDTSHGETAAPELCFDAFNELHAENRVELDETAAGRIHTWITEEHIDYDWFTPTTPKSEYPLASIET